MSFKVELPEFESALQEEGVQPRCSMWRTRSNSLILLQAEPLSSTPRRYQFGPAATMWRFLVSSLRQRECRETLIDDDVVFFAPNHNVGNTDYFRALAEEFEARGLSSACLSVFPPPSEPLPAGARYAQRLLGATLGDILPAIRKAWEETRFLAAVMARLRPDRPPSQTQRAMGVDFLCHFHLWRRLFERSLHQCRAVCVTSEMHEGCAGLLQWAADHDVAAFHFPHGLVNEKHLLNREVTIFTHGAPERELLQESGVPAEKLPDCGHPRQVPFVRRIAKRRASMPPCPAGRVRVLFASQTPEEGYTAEVHAQTLLLVSEAAQKADLHEDDLRIRLHPREDAAQARALVESRVARYHLDTFPVESSLAWADIVISSWSTMIIESLWIDQVPVWITLPGFEFATRRRLIERGCGWGVSTAAELTRLFQAAREPAQLAEMRAQAGAAALVQRVRDPLSTSRAADLIRAAAYAAEAPATVK